MGEYMLSNNYDIPVLTYPAGHIGTMEHHIQDHISPLQPRQDLQLPTQAMSSYGHDQPEVSLSVRNHKN